MPFKLSVPGACGVILGLGLARGWFAHPGPAWALIWAFAWSMVGDWFLSYRAGRDTWFEAGIAGFFLAHLGYISHALQQGRLHRPTLLGSLGVFVPYYLLALAPRISNPVLNSAVLLYLLVSCVALAAAAGLGTAFAPRALYLGAIALVVFSDLVISFKEFLRYHALDWLILPTYYLAHLGATASTLVRVGTRSEPGPRRK